MKWRCAICGDVQGKGILLDKCPVCGAPSEKFVLVDDLENKEEIKNSEVLVTDIIVVGSGAAGLTAAVTAKELGADVIVLEKAKEIGGTTARSGGRYWIANNYSQREEGTVDGKEDCMKYMCKYSFTHKYDANKEYYGLRETEYRLIETYYDNGYKLIEYLRDKGIMESEPHRNWMGKSDVDYMDRAPEHKGIRGRTIHPKTEKGAGITGLDLVNILNDYLLEKDVKARTENRVVDLILKNDKVVGVISETSEGLQKIYARKGVIFGSGGFSHNDELMDRFHLGRQYGGGAVGENEGDFINMTEPLGVKLGNMPNAFRAQSVLEMYLKNPRESSIVFFIGGDSVLLVDKYGNRVVNEKRDYTDRTMVHFEWDPVNIEWKNRFLFMIFDQRTADYWAGFPPYPAENVGDSYYVISADNYDELTVNIDKKLRELREDIGDFELNEKFGENFKNTINKFNDYAKTGKDLDFDRGGSVYETEIATFSPTNGSKDWPEENRKNVSMYPLEDKGPYHAIILGGGTLDTNGGPVIDSNAQVLKNNNEKIIGLYGAGNCIASPSQNAYWGAGTTIGLAMVFGHLAAKHAVEQEDNFELGKDDYRRMEWEMESMNLRQK